jgi:hypothetical protein
VVPEDVVGIIAACLTVDPLARPGAAAVLRNPAAEAALAAFDERARAFGGVTSNVRVRPVKHCPPRH